MSTKEKMDERFECLITKPNLTEAEFAELGAIIVETMRAHPEVFVEEPNGVWSLADRTRTTDLT